MSTGDQLRDQGMTLALEAVPTWSQIAAAVIDVLAEQGDPFTSEDVTRIAGLPRGHVRKDRNNAVGAVIAGAARRGVIVRTGYRKADRSSSHAAIVGVWVGATNELAEDGEHNERKENQP